jgi:molybdopterin-guanine dinucleotide biosynthesis protein B
MRVFGFAGYSGSGKTTLIEQLIPRLTQRGLRVSLMKHAHHAFDIDRPGKDSWRHREAGASEVMITSGQRWVLMHELRGEPEPDMATQLKRFSPCDLILVEGYKRAAIPKIEVHRPATGRSLIHPGDADIVAVAADGPVQTALPVLDLNDYDAVAAFIVQHVGLTGHCPST